MDGTVGHNLHEDGWGKLMSRGKHLSLEEAQKQNRLKDFAKEHPSEGDKDKFNAILEAMAKPPKTQPKGGRT